MGRALPSRSEFSGVFSGAILRVLQFLVYETAASLEGKLRKLCCPLNRCTVRDNKHNSRHSMEHGIMKLLIF